MSITKTTFFLLLTTLSLGSTATIVRLSNANALTAPTPTPTPTSAIHTHGAIAGIPLSPKDKGTPDSNSTMSGTSRSGWFLDHDHNLS